MKAKFLFILSICTLALSCKKSGSSTTTVSSPLLTKYVENQNGDSVIYDLTYDNNKRIINVTFTGNGFGPVPNISSTQIFRNGAGIITRYINSYPSPYPLLNPNDTVIIYYDNASSRYTLLLEFIKFNSSGQPVDRRDSTILVYDNNGKIYQELSYSFDASAGTGYKPFQTEFFEYDQQSNLTTDSLVGISNGISYPQSVIHYQFDAHPNPLSLGNEALLLPDRDWIGLPRISGWFSKNNVVSGADIDLQSSISNFSVQRVFQYRSDGPPLSSTDQWQDTQFAPLTPGTTSYYY